MIITGHNLKALNEQFGIAPANAYDEFSLTLKLDRTITRFKSKEGHITYGEPVQDDWLECMELTDGYILHPGQAVLGCSEEFVRMPKGYIGIIQTKGSLARLFVTVHCCDGQIESGYNGKITFEICNMGQLSIKLNAGCAVAQMFLFPTSDNNISYNGIYNNAQHPTVSLKKVNERPNQG